MISVQTAQELIKEHTHILPVIQIPLKEAVGFVLAEDIIAPINTPPFQQSFVDGYAFCFADWKSGDSLPLSGIIAAGDNFNSFSKGQAVRIFTGALVPIGADTVVMQEDTQLCDNGIVITKKDIEQGANIRPMGSETKKGELALTAATRLTPASIGYLAGLGILEVNVFSIPKVNIIITGNELQQPGTYLPMGKVYESNSQSLFAALKQTGITGIRIFFAADDLESTKNMLRGLLPGCDLLLLSGGVSVGDYDYVSAALTAEGVETIFHKVKQRPGKPLYFGKKGNTLVFGLPGNPSSALTCFYQYVVPCIRMLQGENYTPFCVSLPLTKAYTKKAGLTHFLRGFADMNGVTILSGQESYKMRSFAVANCIVELDEEKENFIQGEPIKTYIKWS